MPMPDMPAKLVSWLKRWDKYRTIILLLVLDTLQAEIQCLYFLYSKVWRTRDAFLRNQLDSIKSSNSGFNQYPSYDIIRSYFIAIGTLMSRMVINWLVLDGILTGITSHVRAGIIGSICTTVYITIGGVIMWVDQYRYFNFGWYYLTLAIIGFVLYGLASAGVLYVLWHEQHVGTLQGYSKHLSASLLLVCGVFIAFVQIQLCIWFVSVIWHHPIDPVFNPQTQKFPI